MIHSTPRGPAPPLRRRANDSPAEKARESEKQIGALVERSASGRSAPTVELNVHRANENALGFYKHVGFAQTGELSGGSVLVMRRKR